MLKFVKAKERIHIERLKFVFCVIKRNEISKSQYNFK
jgi:hypothetical protein